MKYCVVYKKNGVQERTRFKTSKVEVEKDLQTIKLNDPDAKMVSMLQYERDFGPVVNVKIKKVVVPALDNVEQIHYKRPPIRIEEMLEIIA